MRTDTPPAVRLADYRPTDHAIDRVEMLFRLHPTATRVTTTLHARRREGGDTTLTLDGDDLELVSLRLDGEPVDAERYDAAPDRLVIRDLPDAFALTIVTEVDPTANTQLSGLYRTNGTYCTQCEAVGFRRITYMLDRPDVLSVYTVRIEAPDGEPVLMSNGDLVEEGDLDGGGRFAVWHDPHPKPCYLFALVAGDLARITRPFTTASGRAVMLNVWVEHGKEARAEWAMDSLVRSMEWDERRWGREYDLTVFNLVAVSDFNMGAMENKGLNVFNDALVLADPDTATDRDYARIEAVVGHEYFHNWTGNRITCRDWFQLCLKEGLTVYRDHAFQADLRDADVRRIDEVRTLRAIQFPEDQGPLRHPVRPTEVAAIDNFYTATVYEKGSEIVRMIRTLLGADAFRAGMDLYFDRHDGEACTVEQFVACFAEAGDRDLTRFMRWYMQPGTPMLDMRVGREGDDLVLDLAQSQPPAPDGAVPKPLVIPIALELVGGEGEWEAGDGATIEHPDGSPLAVMTGATARLVATGAAAATPSPLGGFSAPVILTRDDGERARLAIAAGAADPVMRWDALHSALLDALVAAVRGGPVPDALSRALADTLGDVGLTPAFRAEALGLPGEAAIARGLRTDVDPDAVRTAREAFLAAFARSQRDLLTALYDRMEVIEAYEPNQEQSGRRSLRNLVLDVLARVEGPERAAAQFGAATNMTDRFAAVATLQHVHGDTVEADDALAAYEARHGGDPLAMDKWLGVQAMRPGANALAAVEALEAHPAYSPSNPNRVRALWGAFASNPTGFHRADGAGYAAVCDRLATIDRANPQLAARLATVFRTWRQLEPGRRELARSALNGLMDRGALSPDLIDIVRRTLGGA